MGADKQKDSKYVQCLGSILLRLNDNIESTIKKSNSDSITKEIVNILSTFLMSDDFIPFYFLTNKNFLLYICLVCENQGDLLLFIKILLPLLDELKNLKFETKLWQAENSESEKKNILASYLKKNLLSISKSEFSDKIIEKSNKVKSLKDFVKFFTNVVNYIFKKDYCKNNDEFISTVTVYTFYLKVKIQKVEIIQELIDNLMQLEDNLKYTKEILYFIIFALNTTINYTKVSEFDDISEDKNKHFEKLVNSVDLEKNFIWVFYEQTYNNKNNKKYTEYAYVGTKLYEKEKLPINVFETINKKENNNPIDAYISKSLFSNFEVIIIKLNLEYFKKFKINIEELKKDINSEIELLNKSNDLSTYIIIEKKLIKYPQSYDLFLQELLEKKVCKEEEIAEEKKKINENVITMQNNKEDKCKIVDLKEFHSDKEKDIKMKI